MSYHGLTNEQQQQSFFCVLLRAKQTARETRTESQKNGVGKGWEGREKGKIEKKKSDKEDMERLVGNSLILEPVGYSPQYSNFSINKQTLSLTSLPSTPVGVGLGCSSWWECVLAVWDHPMVTQWVGLPEETSNSVRTFLWARSLQAVWLWSAFTHTHAHLAKILSNLFIWGLHCF